MADDHFIQGAIKHPGWLTEQAKKSGAWRGDHIDPSWLRRMARKSGHMGQSARLALTMKKM